MYTKYKLSKREITNIKHKDIFVYARERIFAKNHGCSVIIPHVCNNMNAFGAGFAKAVASHYPIVKENYHMLGQKFLQENPGYTQFIEVLHDNEYGHKLIFANMIAQNGLISEKNNRPLNYLALVKCMTSIQKYISSYSDSDNRIEIHCPKFGSGLSGGNWNFIVNLMEDIWYNNQIFVYVL